MANLDFCARCEQSKTGNESLCFMCQQDDYGAELYEYEKQAMMKIISCKIGPMPSKLTDPQPSVTVTFEDGREKKLFEFYSDEIMFSPCEIIGKTEQEVHDLYAAKDAAYLRA